jgi:hypothetical protein
MILTNISLDRQKLALLEAQLVQGEIQWPETLNSAVTEMSYLPVALRGKCLPERKFLA